MARRKAGKSPHLGGKSGSPLREDREAAAPDYDLPLEDPPAKELVGPWREDHLVLSLKAVPEPVVEIFLDQLPAYRGKDQAHFVLLIARGRTYCYYSVPFASVVPMLAWVPMSQEARPRWRLTLFPRQHKLVGRNRSRVENVDLEPYYNTPPK